MSNDPSPAAYQDLTEKVYEEIKRRIIRREFLPEQRLVSEDLAHLLGVSRTPVKYALQKLAVEGLVNETPRRGATVAGLNARDVDELFDLRLMIELHAVAGALPKLGAAECRTLRALIEPIGRQITDDTFTDYDAFLASDRAFHTSLVNLAGNRRLARIYEQLDIHMHIARAYYLRTDRRAWAVHAEHLAIIELCERHDLEGVQVALREHINTGRAFVTRNILEFSRVL